MIFRFLSFAGGLAGAVALSQFPEFSQQYLQRLAGSVDELRAMVVSFDETAARANMTRDEALADLTGSEFREGLRRDKTAQIRRYERLAADYGALRHSDPVDRLLQVFRFTDPDLARRTWSDFRPAVPVTRDGLLFAGIGFAAGWLILAGVVAAVGRMFRRRDRRGPQLAPVPRTLDEPTPHPAPLAAATAGAPPPLRLRHPLGPEPGDMLTLEDRGDGAIRRADPAQASRPR